jgi:hypothetical protein
MVVVANAWWLMRGAVVIPNSRHRRYFKMKDLSCANQRSSNKKLKRLPETQGRVAKEGVLW